MANDAVGKLVVMKELLCCNKHTALFSCIGFQIIIMQLASQFSEPKSHEIFMFGCFQKMPNNVVMKQKMIVLIQGSCKALKSLKFLVQNLNKS